MVEGVGVAVAVGVGVDVGIGVAVRGHSRFRPSSSRPEG